LVVDCGMPGIHDPGSLLIARAREARIPVATVPGPSIATAALTRSGFFADRFVFAGALPGTTQSLQRFLRGYQKEPGPVIFLATRKGLSQTVRSFGKLFGSRQIALIADLTKPGEIVWIGTGRSIVPRVNELSNAAEITVVLEGATKQAVARPARSAGRTPRLRVGG
jgi:16S rRNA (cytidine1402-2'-O)-methyltransferase